MQAMRERQRQCSGSWRAWVGVLCVLGVVLWPASPAYSDAGDSGPQRGQQLAADLEVVSVQGGTFRYLESGEQVFEPTQELVMRPGTTYGWQITLRTSRREVQWEERLTLPTAPTQWGISSQVTLSPDRRRATTRSSSLTQPVKGLGSEVTISNYWFFTQGDPPGVYTMDVRLEGQLVGTLSLRVTVP